jgi:hypothetical protein
MDQQPAIAIPTTSVADLAGTLAALPGFQRRDTAPGDDLAVVIDPDGDVLLLVGPSVGDPAPFLQTSHIVRKRGDVLQFRATDLDAIAAALAAQGLAPGAVGQTSWGDGALSVQGLDGYTLRFTQSRLRAPDEWIALYLRGPEAIAAAVAGLTEAELDWRPISSGDAQGADAEAAWSIRQIVHHVADGDDMWALPLKVAVATSGARYYQEWYSPDNAWADALDYAHHDIPPALALLRATRAHTVQLLRTLPDAWERNVLFTGSGMIEPRPISAGDIVAMQARHALIHADSIQAIRHAHGN